MSMPERSILTAQECLRTWGVTFLLVREGQAVAAVAAWRLTQSSMASWLIGRAAPGREQGAARPAGVFAEPCGQDVDGVAEQRCHPVFPALAVAFQVGAVAQVGVGAGEAGQFAGAQARGDGGQQQGVVAAACPGAGIGRLQESGDFLLGQVGDDGGPEPLAGDGQDAGDVVGVLGVLRGGVGEHRVDGGQPQVPGPDGVAPLVLEVVEETGDQRRAEVGEVEFRGCLALLGGGEQQQEPPGGAVGADGVAAGLELPHQPVGEERLQGRREQRHDCPAREAPPARSTWACSRCAASAISSGDADTYQ